MRFILLVDDSSIFQQNQITKYLKDKRVGYWHFFSDAWLILDPSNFWTVESIRNDIREIIPGPMLLVIKIDDPSGWAGYGSPDKFKWLMETWKRQGAY